MTWQNIVALCIGSFTLGMVFAWALDAIELARARRPRDPRDPGQEERRG